MDLIFTSARKRGRDAEILNYGDDYMFNALPDPIDDSDSSEEDSYDEDEDEEDDNDNDLQPPKKKLKNIDETSSDDESSSDGEGEVCAICLKKLGKAPIGSPETCDHIFCLKCILEWSKNVNTCPIDRSKFNLIFARDRITDVDATIINVKVKDKVDNIFDITLCEVCRLGDREDELLLCDGCNKGYHIDCLFTPLDRVPRGDWFCDACELSRSERPGSSRMQNIRMLARTLLHHRVLSDIRRGYDHDEESRTDLDNSDEDSDDMGDYNLLPYTFNDDEQELPRVTPSVPQRRKSRKKKKSSRKKSSNTRGSSTKSKRRKNSKRKRKRSRRKTSGATRQSHPRDSSGLLRRKKRHRPTVNEILIGNHLSIRGSTLLPRFRDENPGQSTSNRESEVSASRIVDNSLMAIKPGRSFDILGEILNSQTLLHSNLSQISRDGRLVSKEPLPDMRMKSLPEQSCSTNFFLRDSCSPTLPIMQSSLPSSSSSPTRSSPSPDICLRNIPCCSSPYSEFSDSSNGSCHSSTWLNYQQKYESIKNNDDKVSNEKNVPNFKKTSGKESNLLEPSVEYSPVCLDDDDDDNDDDDNNKSKSKVTCIDAPCENRLPGEHDSSSEVVSDETALESCSSQSAISSSRLLHHSSPTPKEEISGDSHRRSLVDECSSSQGSSDSITKINNELTLVEARPPTNETTTADDLVNVQQVTGREVREPGQSSNDIDRIPEDEDSRMDLDNDIDMDESSPCDDNPINACNSSHNFTKEEKMKKLQMVENLVKDSLKLYYVNKQISKDDYKLIMKKAVLKIMGSRDKRVDPTKVKKFVDQYVIAILSKK